jgi:chorismate mutase
MERNLDIIHFHKWLSISEPLLIAGPCGAESEQQIYTTAQQIASDRRIKIFRAGVWKPRTRPNSFEGVGEIALTWLQNIKSEFNLLTAVEVANATHVEKALKHNVDILWIGARTTVNPFSVQEIADALRGVDIPIMVKNPVHADLQLWIGALERINQAGIKKLLAVHRGFYNSNKTIYRNDPMWEIAIELKTVFPELPIICDPSHIAGKRNLIKSVSQKAIDLGMEGLMIETHIDPTRALSDAAQQVKPTDLKLLLNELIFRKSISEDKEFKDKLVQFRQIIDELDEEMVELLKRRNDVIEKIGKYKKEHGITIFQLQRWMEILKTRNEWAASKGFTKDFIEKLCQLLHEESIRVQTDLMNQND